MGSFSYTPDARFSEKLTLLMPVLMWSLCYSLHASFILEEFPLKTPSEKKSLIYIPDDDRFSEE